jgi:hypothetical protein
LAPAQIATACATYSRMRGLLPIIVNPGPDSAGANDSVDSVVEGPRVPVDAAVEGTDLSVGTVGADDSVNPERSASMPATRSSAATPPITSQLMRGGRRIVLFLRPSRPGDKYLTSPLEALPSTEELCQRGRSQSVGRDRGEQNEYRLALSEVDVLRLVDKPEMPAKRSPLVLRQLSVGQQERELEGFCQADELELRRGRQRLGDIPAIERSAEAVVSRALRGHERMFAWRSRSNRPNAIVSVRVLREERAIILGADERPGIAGERHYRKRPKDGIDCAALEAELAQVRAGEESAGSLEELGGGSLSHPTSSS